MGVGVGLAFGTPHALAHAMSLLFSIKRLYWSMLRPIRQMARWYDLTPARIDMLRIIRLHQMGVPQWKVVEVLDIAEPAVSRMLGILERLGYIERHGILSDPRALVVQMTPYGKMVVDRFIEEQIATD